MGGQQAGEMRLGKALRAHQQCFQNEGVRDALAMFGMLPATLKSLSPLGSIGRSRAYMG